jgi:hypothetical protein
MAYELIKNDKVIRNLDPGAKRLTYGCGLYLLPAAKPGGQHGWRFDYVFEGKRKTISLPMHPMPFLGRQAMKRGSGINEWR